MMVCPFGNSCPCHHAHPDNTIATPEQQVQQPQQADVNGITPIVNAPSYWDSFFQRDWSTPEQQIQQPQQADVNGITPIVNAPSYWDSFFQRDWS